MKRDKQNLAMDKYAKGLFKFYRKYRFVPELIRLQVGEWM